VFGPPAVPERRLTTGPANLRELPGLDCAVLAMLSPQTPVRTRGGSVDVDGVTWLPVEAAGIAGWIAADLLETAPAPTEAATVEAGIPLAVDCVPPDSLPPAGAAVARRTSAVALNVRAGPGLSCPVVGALPLGSAVVAKSGEVRADGRLWLLIEADGLRGWVAAEFVRDGG
jgi:uncharacterized protein YraI